MQGFAVSMADFDEGGLGHEDDDVHGADIVGVVGCLEAGDLVMPIGSYGEVHAVCGDLVHMGLERVDQGHVSTASAEIGSEYAACCTGTDHCDFHVNSSLLYCLGLISGVFSVTCAPEKNPKPKH
jgi:hypothetical protein